MNSFRSNQPEVMCYLEKISRQQQQTIERLDALIAVLSGLSEHVDIQSDKCMPDTVISPLTQETRESTVQTSKDINVFSLRQKATSAKNFFC